MKFQDDELPVRIAIAILGSPFIHQAPPRTDMTLAVSPWQRGPPLRGKRAAAMREAEARGSMHLLLGGCQWRTKDRNPTRSCSKFSRRSGLE
jgi:hypothetical protein